MKEEKNNDAQKFRKIVRKRTLQSFAVFFLCGLLAFGIYKWIIVQPKEDRALGPFRSILDFNAKIFSRCYDNPVLAKEFPKKYALKNVRVNGNLGMKSILDTGKWILRVVRFSTHTPQPSDTIHVSLRELKSLPKTEVVFNFKCIEGWSQITWWGGVRFKDFAEKYSIGTRDQSKPNIEEQPQSMLSYCGLVTPDKEYYVGIDMPSMMHPQTILCYEMNGKELPENQGAPLRLIIPVKYGIKHIKRLGTIFFSDERPRDYWALRGYDYFSGL